MPELSDHARQLLDHLRRDKTFFRSYDPEPLFHQWDNYVQRVSFFNRYPDMTDHGQAHANSVVSLVAQVSVPVKGEKGPLNASEVFCLTAAAWLHDIGMYTTGDAGEDIFDPMGIRARHCCLSRDRMREEREIIFPGLPESDVWIISAIAAYHQSRTAIDDGHLQILAEAAQKAGKRLHLVKDMPTLEDELASQGWQDGVACLARLLPPGHEKHDAERSPQPVRVKLLAAILRLLDQCDIQMVRAGNLDFLMRRVSRSEQQQALYKKLRESFVPRDGSAEGEKLQRRFDEEITYFSETHVYCLRDFWVERTFIVGNRIFVKLNDVAHIQSQFELVPPSLASAVEVVRKATQDPAFYLEHARDYILKELTQLADRYLKPAGLDLRVEEFPSDPLARGALQLEVRARAPYPDPTPPRPQVFAQCEAPRRLARRVVSGNEGRIVVVYGPPGRGRKQFCRSLAESVLQGRGHGDLSSMWWHAIGREAQVNDAVRHLGSYLASHGEYALSNVMQDETLVTRKHVAFFLKLLNSAELPTVVVLQDLNRVEASSRVFFGELFRALEGKVAIAITTRWPSPDAQNAYFEGIEDQVRFVHCPRVPRAGGREAVARIARGAKIESNLATAWIEEWRARWDSWGRESVVLGALAEYAWVFRSRPASFPSIIEGKIRAGLVGAWENLGDRAVAETLLAFTEEDQRGQNAAGRLEIGQASSAIQNLVDRGLVRWELAPGVNPWVDDDEVELLTSRPEPAAAAWVHPGFVRCLAPSDRDRMLLPGKL